MARAASCFSLLVSLARLWSACGLEPAAIVCDGPVAEAAALVVAGCLPLRSASVHLAGLRTPGLLTGLSVELSLSACPCPCRDGVKMVCKLADR